MCTHHTEKEREPCTQRVCTSDRERPVHNVCTHHTEKEREPCTQHVHTSHKERGRDLYTTYIHIMQRKRETDIEETERGAEM